MKLLARAMTSSVLIPVLLGVLSLSGTVHSNECQDLEELWTNLTIEASVKYKETTGFLAELKLYSPGMCNSEDYKR